MNTHGNHGLLAVTIVLTLSLLTSTDTTRSADLTRSASPDLCGSVPTRTRSSAAAPGGLTGIAAAIVRAPDANITGLIGALGQMIVESELSHAAVSGQFEPVIRATVAGSDFALEVCRDTIVGEVSVAEYPGVRFVIGDFDGDGATDVAVRRHGSLAWSVDLGALRRSRVGLGAPARLRLIEAAQPRIGVGVGRCQVTWLARVLGADDGGQHHG